MTTPGLEGLAVPQGELSKSGNWRLKGSIRWQQPTRGENERKLAGKLSSQLLKLQAVSRSTSKIKIKPSWYRAGIAHCSVNNAEAHSEQLPLGGSYLVFPLSNQSYEFSVWPVQWLPNLTVKVYEYTGIVAPAAPAVERIEQLVQQLANEYRSG